MICIYSDNRLIGLACPLWFWASHTLTSPSCFNLIGQSFILQLQSSLRDVNIFELVTTICYAFHTCIRSVLSSSVDFSKTKILFPSPGGLLIPHHERFTAKTSHRNLKKEENVAEKGKHSVWDTDTLLHKTFRDLAEKEARSNRKKEFKTDRLPKRACCVLVYFLRLIQF